MASVLEEAAEDGGFGVDDAGAEKENGLLDAEAGLDSVAGGLALESPFVLDEPNPVNDPNGLLEALPLLFDAAVVLLFD